ncbi:2647_t:CDS:1 [Dentiscutata erythropus]|uniref:2647_t:CDS:1 n=1 Tax=Dentiscutata erythropus TaxID=1348616 RepID=A0A9N9NPW3_9GLOM|nr:2647_t:CDS:1 [Dentiscutata erythropus]
MATIDISPTYPTFSMANAAKSKIHNQIPYNQSTPHGQSTPYDQITPHSQYQIISHSQNTPHGQIVPQITSYPSTLLNILSAMPPFIPPTMQPGFNPYVYPYYPFYYQIPQPQTISGYNISLTQFFSKLDRIHNCKYVYTAFEKSFDEYEITVNGIKELTDEQLDKLGVTKDGWHINIRQEARKY